MDNLKRELSEQIEGEVHFDSITRCVYSVDASIFELQPLGVIIPKSKADLIQAVKIAYAHRIPITVRGAATGITGGCLGKGLIIDTSKYLHKTLEINIEQGYAICEPGVVQDELNAQLAVFGYRLGPDTSTGNRATLGGMLANNAAGARSLRYGKMVDHVQSVELILANGEPLRFEQISNAQWKQKAASLHTEGRIYAALWHIKNSYHEEIEKRFPSIPRRVSGYNLDELIKPEPLNVSKLIVGSEGTLGIVTEIKVSIVPKAQATGLCLIHFDDMIKAMRYIPEFLSHRPMALEMIDDQIIELGRASPSLRGQLDWLHGHPQTLFIVELEGNNTEDVKQKIERFAKAMREKQIGYAQISLLDPIQMAKVWALRKAGLGILLSKRTYSRAIAFIEDLTIAPERLADFMAKFQAYLESKGKTAGIYGHVGSGCMHVRPYIDLGKSEEFALMKQMMLDVADLVLENKGALSGEHGDGLIRSWLNPKMFGEKLMHAFVEIKQAFDPDNLMNPGKIVFPTDPFHDLRMAPNHTLKGPETFLNFQREGGFELAVDLCNGNGLCRKKEKIMCPSFQITDDEFHSTRARAQALRSIVHGHLPLKDFTSQGMYEVMDLCISCKGCKTECPSQVDMAKMKSEFLYHYQQEHGYRLRNHLFGNIGYFNQWMSRFPKLANYLNQSFLGKKALNSIGITSERPLPSLASYTFSSWLNNFTQPRRSKQVALFNDTFTEFNHPSLGQAAIKVLNALGYEVIVPPWKCCGRPFLSKGMLKQARRQALALVQSLSTYANAKLPIIGLEPSCLLTIKDDYQDLIPTDNPLFTQIPLILSSCITWDEFLSEQVDQGNFNLPFREQNHIVKVHGHCYQKSLVGMKPTHNVLNAIPGLKFSEIQSGCCGMAGSFGYEAEHYSYSMQMGELRLFPAVRASQPETQFVANGTSCRHQIKDGTQRQALHLAEFIAAQLN